jgi:hypothetical protein
MICEVAGPVPLRYQSNCYIPILCCERLRRYNASLASNGNEDASMLLWECLEIRLDENLDRLFIGVNLDPNRRIAQVIVSSFLE